jgi:hypothetical protein
MIQQESGLNIAANGRILHKERGFTLTRLAGTDYPLLIGTVVSWGCGPQERRDRDPTYRLPKLGFAMADTPAITDRNLEATTNISLKREPACFAFLSPRSVSPPMPIDSINLDLASADYFDGRASLWTALEMRSSVSDERPTAILGFDETFLRPFARALIEAATTRAAYRMTILQEARASERCRVVEYVTGPGKALEELMLQPFDNVVLISAAKGKDGDETLFQLPRTDTFLRAFAKMAYVADQALHDLLEDMERMARQRKPVTNN